MFARAPGEDECETMRDRSENAIPPFIVDSRRTVRGSRGDIHVDVSVMLFAVSHSWISGKDSFSHSMAKLAYASTIAIVYPTVFMVS